MLKLLKSAIANASNNHGLVADDLYVAKFSIDGGATMKRFMARARGRACRIRCRTSHATIVLREKFSMSKVEVAQKAAEQTVAKKTTKKTATKKTTAAKSQGGKA